MNAKQCMIPREDSREHSEGETEMSWWEGEVMNKAREDEVRG